MMRSLLRLSLFAACLPLFLLGARGASAGFLNDVVRLKSGETVVGRVLFDRTNEQVLVVEDYVTGGVREIAWDAVNKEDREKLEDVGGLFTGGSEKELFIKCETLTVRQQNGSTILVRGVVEGEEGAFLLVRTGATRDALRIEKSRIVSREDAECAPDDVYTPEELYARMKKEIDPQDARGWFRLARKAEQVGAYPGAKEAYETAAADEAFLQRALAQAGAARCAAILKDTEALETLRSMRNGISNTDFRRVRELIDGFDTKHPEASDGVKKQLEGVKTTFAAKRSSYFAEEAGRKLIEILKTSIHTKVAPKDALYNDVQAWSRKEGIDGAFKELTTRFQSKDPLVTPEEAKSFFDARPKRSGSWKFAKYAGGSFLIEPPTIKPPSNNRPAGGGNKSGGKNQGPAVEIPIPPPPTRDGWWAKANAEERTGFWLASIVEKSGVFEVAAKRDRSNCALCLGEGLITKVMSNATQLSYLCPRCGGARFDLTVKFR